MRFKYAAACVAIKDDFCLEETIHELYRQGVSRVLVVSPEHYWFDGKPQSDEDLENLYALCRRTGASLLRTDLKAPQKEHNALYSEAMYRNAAIDLLTGSDTAVDYVLTVDADELWTPGTLEHVDSIAGARSENPLTICLPGIPVIGVPGLPVAGAKDNILVATNRVTRFTWGRSTDGARKFGTQPVLHFSATRRTLQEVIDKSINSAHYPDKTYDFDGWIANVLPHIHVGMKNVHMYKSEVNIWPEVRAWTPEELTMMPPSLLPYLKT